jgi:hypothetical protein
MTPQTKKDTIKKRINDINPIDIIKFMKDNNIPDDAYFDTEYNGDDGYTGEFFLSYDIDIPTTNKDKLQYIKRTFNGSLAWRSVYDLLTQNGYKRNGYNTALLKEFDDTSVYDMYMKKDFDRLVKYYSLPFAKV